MRILITNDDGIASPSLYELVKWAQTKGEVTVVAPKHEQSGKSQGIELIKPIEIKRTDRFPGALAYVVDSTPADCVRFGIIGLKTTYDLVISGINRGYNIGKDIVYSGTVGAIYEANALGGRAMAVSTDFGSYELAVANLERVYTYIEENRLFDLCDLYNVNIPADTVKGIRITRQGGAYYSDDFILVGEDLYKQDGVFMYHDTKNLELDTDAVKNGYISIMPLTVERTDMHVYEKLKSIE